VSAEDRPDLTQVDTWLFDLDDTLYPPACQLMGLVDERMTAFVVRQTGLPWDEARALQKSYYHAHGTTLAGLMQFHRVEPAAFIAEVQDVAMDCLSPDPALRAALQRLQGRRLVFTNAGGRYAEQVLAKLEIADLFEDVFHIEAADYIPKPQVATFDRMLKRHAVQPASSAFFEDSERNLAPAAALGMTTILVGPHALTSTAPFVHHRTEHLAPFLEAARLRQDS
jgi:putative hydrolase of the HAD superfamily